jgi:hypothetical protein
MVELVDHPGFLSVVVLIGMVVVAVVLAFVDATFVVLSEFLVGVDADDHHALVDEVLESSA